MTVADAPSTALRAGSRVDRFEIVRLVGAGGMGAVYEARDPDLARAVALKLIHEPDAHRSMRFLREAQALAQLQHPNVVAVYDIGADGDRVFIAMELVDGESLDQRAARRGWREVVTLFVQVGRGLAAAHAKDLVHRDVKPSNIFLGADGRARIGDFGLARLGEARDGGGAAPPELPSAMATTVDDRGDDGDPSAAVTPVGGLLGSTLTGVGAYIGTPRYMAPEQHARRSATARSDQFSFCVAMWESLFGEHPFEQDAAGWAEPVIADRRRPRPRGAPAWLVRALDRGLAHDPDARHSSMTALCDLLERTPVRRRRALVGVVGAVALGGAALVLWQVADRPAARVPCERAGDAALALWTPAQQERLRAGFAPVRPFGGDTATRTVAAVDGWTGRWRGARIDTCRATHERGEQSAEVFDRRMACLDRELSLASAVLERLSGGGPRAAAGALAAIDGLPAPEACNAARLQAATPIPDDPRVAGIRRELDAMHAASAAGDLPEARRRVAAARALADALGHPGLRAEVLLAVARYTSGQDPKAAQAAREEALAQASLAGDRDLEATATLRLLDAASQRADPKAIEVLLPIARAAVARDGVPPSVRLDFDEDEARALARLGRYDDALGACARLAVVEPPPQPRATQCRCVAAVDSGRNEGEAPCRAALAAAEDAYGPSHPTTVSRMITLATALKRLGKLDEAIALDARALPIEEAASGPDSEDVAKLLGHAINRLIAAGRLEEAAVAATRALAIYRRLDDPDRPSRLQGQAEQNLADVLVRSDQLDEGLAHADRAMQIFEVTVPADHPDLIKMYANYGNINMAAERWPVVERAMTRCAEIALAVHGENHPLRALCLLGVAQVQLAQGHAADAVASARGALEVITALKLNPANLAAAHGVLGRALGESGDRAGARQHLDLAIAIYKQLGPGGADGLDQARLQRQRF
ncbi:MAG: serine/threonine protein kinase [Myxococcales bacterium]|nr:serine/threonine protein kinase [Myxococcales bacterium]